MRTFKTKRFSRFARREGLDDSCLRDAVQRVERGPADAELGGGVIKQRVARRGQGKSGGFRIILLIRRGELAFFVHGFAKNDRGNLEQNEIKAYRKLADKMLELSDEELEIALSNGSIIEVSTDG